ncbi:MAG: TOBE domain-containing protein [Candidatus Rokuibacteriota bacterium]
MVEEAIYLGGLMKYLVRTGTGELLVVRAPRTPGAETLPAGAAVGVEWEPRALRLV